MSDREAIELEGMIRRTLRSLVRRAAEGDTTALESLALLEEFTASATTLALAASHVTWGGHYTYGELAQTTRTSRQAVQQRVARQAAVPVPVRTFLLAPPA